MLALRMEVDMTELIYAWEGVGLGFVAGGIALFAVKSLRRLGEEACCWIAFGVGALTLLAFLLYISYRL